MREIVEKEEEEAAFCFVCRRNVSGFTILPVAGVKAAYKKAVVNNTSPLIICIDAGMELIWPDG